MTQQDRGPPKIDYEAIVTEALTEPGKIHERYSAFHNFSIGNQWLAMLQLGHAEPISTFPGWKALGRNVKKGSKAIELIMPVFRKDKDTDDESMFFMPKRAWFPLSQTEGAEYVPTVPEFDIRKAAEALGIKFIPFESMDGNCQGYAKPATREIAVSPIAFDALKTIAHEAFHILLEHSSEMPKPLKESEAELSAYLLKAALGITEGLEFSRGYIAHYLADGTKEKIRFSKVFGAVDKVLKAGRIESPERPMVFGHSDLPTDRPGL